MNEYIIIGTAVDYGRGQDGKEWTGLRLVAQKVTQEDGFTKIFKCRVPLDKLLLFSVSGIGIVSVCIIVGKITRLL